MRLIPANRVSCELVFYGSTENTLKSVNVFSTLCCRYARGPKYDPETVKKEEEFRCVRAACDKEEARVAIKTLERFHYFERGSKTRRESDRGVLEDFNVGTSLLHKSRKVDTKMRIYFYNALLSRYPLKFYAK